ncbi:MAG: DUF5312 domain-containing protein [Treponema sp.]|jgi:hypothetical protein|nr:DUF5312 domain-containing protein [Treponema sp.]
MNENGTFARLSTGLSLDERKNLLEKLQNQSNISKEPLYAGNVQDAPAEEFDRQFARLPWYCRLWLWILGIIKAKSPFKMFQEREIAKIGKLIDAQAPGLFDYSRGLLLAEFHTHLAALKSSARFFYTALDASINRDRGAFYAFLGSLEMEAVHFRLVKETTPEYFIENNPDIDSQDFHQIAYAKIEAILGTISERERQAMYDNARSLNCLKQLASFLFDRILMAFSSEASGTVCSAILVKDMLNSLNNILYSLMTIPAMTVLESLFIFIVQDRAGEPEFDINAELHALLNQAESSIIAIREFNQRVPLTLIIRCAAKNPSLAPSGISGGEDWFVVYRDYWKHHTHTQLTEYLRNRRHENLRGSFQHFFKGSGLRFLDNVYSETNQEGIPVRGAFGLAFLLTFYSVVFLPDINKVLRPIMIDGEFYEREDRIEFTENYNELFTLENTIKKFDGLIAPAGDFGKRLLLAKGEMSSIPIKRRKIQVVTEEASDEAQGIINRAKEALAGMISVIYATLKTDTEGKFATLANLQQLAKGNNLLDGLKESVVSLEKALKLLDEIEILDIGC